MTIKKQKLIKLLSYLGISVFSLAFLFSAKTSFAANYTVLSQWGSFGAGNGQFSGLYDIASDASGNMYITDSNNSRVQKFTSTGVYSTKWGTWGSGNGQFANPSPYGVAVDTSGNIYVADNNNWRIEKFTSAGAYVTQWGSNGSGNGQFKNPTDIATDASGNVYVVDGQNNRIQKFTSAGAYITQWGTAGSGNGQFNTPSGIAIDPSGNVYVVDYINARIEEFTSSGTYLTQWGGGGNRPFRIAIDASGNIYVTDSLNSHVQKITAPLIDNAAFVSYANLPVTVTPGQVFTASITMNNDGDTTWTTAANYKLGSQIPQDNITWGPSRIVLPSSIVPGANGTFTATFTAPITLGAYNFQWQMLIDGVKWFGDTTPGQLITVANPLPPNNLTVSVATGLTVSSALPDATFTCAASTCTKSYPAGTVVTLNPTSFQPGYTFSSWIGCDSTSGSTCTVTMNTPKSVQANDTCSTSDNCATTTCGNSCTHADCSSGVGTLSCPVVGGNSNIKSYKEVSPQ